MESHKPCKNSSTSSFPSKKEERPKKSKGEEDERTLYKVYYSRAGRDLWRTSDVVPCSEVGLAKPDPFLTLVFSHFRVHTAKSIYIFPKLNNLEKKSALINLRRWIFPASLPRLFQWFTLLTLLDFSCCPAPVSLASI